MEFSSARWQAICNWNNTMYGRILMAISHVWACKVLLSVLLELHGRNSEKYFQNFCPDCAIAGIQQLQCYHKWLEAKENLSMNDVNRYSDKRNGFAEVAVFCHVTCRYWARFLLQVYRNRHQACFFYLATGLICEGYWQVNSHRSIFSLRTLPLPSKMTSQNQVKLFNNSSKNLSWNAQANESNF